MNEALHYNQVTLIPNKCVVNSRSECDTTVNFCGYMFDLPIVPANMESVISVNNAKWLAFNKHFYIYHRFGNTRDFISQANFERWPLVSISIGVQEADVKLIEWLAIAKYKVDFITIDIAHGFAHSVDVMINKIKLTLPGTKIIAGNVWGDKTSIDFLQDAGADAIKVGLSCGAGCSTFNETGFGSPMFTAALEAGRHAEVPIILDGGVRYNGDIAKAIVAFTSVQGEHLYGGIAMKRYPYVLRIPMIMAGSIFAACIDAPGETVTEIVQTGWCENEVWKTSDIGPYKSGNEIVPRFEKKNYKKYYGSASAESKKNTKQEVKHVEGKTVLLECNGLTYEQKYKQIKESVQSQISYAGGTNLTALKDVQWRKI